MGKASKIVKTVISLGVLAAAGVGGYFLVTSILGNPGGGTGGTGPSGGPPEFHMVVLEVPSGVMFNDENFTVNWDEVDHASSYEVKHNNTTVDVGNTTSAKITLQDGDNVFQVRAIGDDIIYSNSEWSLEVTYHYDGSNEEKTIYEIVRDKIMSAADEIKMDFIGIVGISYASTEGARYGENLIFETIWKDNGVEKNVRLGYLVEGCTDIQDALNKFKEAELKSGFAYKTVNYKSAEALIKSGTVGGEACHISELQKQGYTVSVIESAVREGKKAGDAFLFDFTGTFKAVNGSDVQYFTATYSVRIGLYSSEAKNNYINSVVAPELRTITETSLVVHESDGTLPFITEWVERHNQAASILNSRAMGDAVLNLSYRYDDCERRRLQKGRA